VGLHVPHAVAHWETSLHGMELVPSLDLRHSQRHHRTMTNAVKGDLLNAGRNVMDASINEGTPSINGVHGRIRRKLERLQLHCQGWQSQKRKNYQDKDSRNHNGGVPRVHLTCHHGVGFSQPYPNSTGLLFGSMKGRLGDPETDLKLAIFPSCLEIAVLGRPPLLEEALSIVAIVRVGGIRR